MNGLFALGSNGSGQLGIGHTEDVSVPKQVQFDSDPDPDDQITKVAAGGNHTILLTASGKAYQSGAGATTTFHELVIPDGGSVTHVACTWASTVLAVRDAHSGQATRVYAMDLESEAEASTLTLIPNFPPTGTAIVDLAAGFRHVVAVLDSGEVYGWGHGRKGQLGALSNTDAAGGVARAPRKIEGIGFKAARAVCCQHATCVVGAPGDGRVRVLGADKWGLVSGAPREVPNWKTVGASWGGVYVLRRDGRLVAWGRDDHGQLPPAGLPELAGVAAGSEHVVALSEEGEVLSWGWGEHGNCGPRVEEKSGDVKGRWNVLASLKHLPEGASITTIGAGCATSWINIENEGIFL
ncbi:RCC1/BLIP-II [Whalleya microplaca]|nr:RCC1/BLIP-II [Whalleya microplaca]